MLSLLEACFQADHGMVSALAYSGNKEIQHSFVTTGGSREAELVGAPIRQRVQQGVRDYAVWYGANFPITGPNEKPIRFQSQRLLFVLSYFPAKLFRNVGYKLAHIEPTDDKAATPLILSRGKGVLGWFNGLRSPWKGGYFMENGGHVAAFAYFILSAVFAYLSEERKMAIRRILFGKHA